MPTLIATIVGAVLGAAWGRDFDILAGAVLGGLLARSVVQARAIAALKKSLAQLHSAPVASTKVAPSVEPERLPDAEFVTMARVADPLANEVVIPAAVAPVAPTSAAVATPRPDPFAPIKRWLFGGNTIVKAGVGILFIGLAFLAKFASEHVQVPIEFRLAAIGGAALVLLGVGWRLRLKRPGYAHALQGGAIAVLYLMLFVAFRFYDVLAVGPVFAMMLVVTALAAALAVLQDARSLAIIGALGGFAAPLLVSTGSGSHVALFGYYLVLDLGIAAVAWHKTWRPLNLIGFFCTFVVGTAWGVLQYRHDDYASSQLFLVAYFLLFNAIMLMPARQRPGPATTTSRGDVWVNGSLLFGLPTATFALQYALVHDTAYGVALSTLAMAAFYVALAAWVRRRPRLAVVFEGTLAVGVVLLTLVIPFALDARSTAGAWALEGAGLVWLGFRQLRRLSRALGYALLLLSGLSMLWGHQRFGMPMKVFNATLFNALLAAGASLAASYFVHRSARPAVDPADMSAARVSGELVAEPLLIGWATLWLVSAIGLHIDVFVMPRFQPAAWLVCLSAIALLCAVLAMRLDWRRVSLPAMAQAPVMAIATLAAIDLVGSPFADGGWWAWPIALLTHAVVLRGAAPRWPRWPRLGVHALGLLVVAALGALQGRDSTSSWGDPSSAWAWLGWLVVPALLLLWLPRPAAARAWPLRLEPTAYQRIAGGVLCFGLLLWTLLANIASDGSARPLPHVPLLNPLDLGVAVALVASASWMRGEAACRAARSGVGWPVATLAACAFVWLNAMLVRGFHHYAGVPYEIEALMHSVAVQTGITLLWSVTALALMWFSAKRGSRVPWVIGASLLGAVVLKLLLVDLSGSGTVARIVSFIGVGVLMLVIGYVAPLPGKAARREPVNEGAT